jgi:hypothetical protein
MMVLQEELDKIRSGISIGGFPMSIGEWISLYKKDEIALHPKESEDCWSNEQKTHFIESILLGIPLPPILVSQRPDGVWDVYDGSQRLATIYESAGILKDEEGKLVEPLVLTKGQYFSALEGKKWDDAEEGEEYLNSMQKFLIRSAKITVKIIFETKVSTSILNYHNGR